MREKAVETWRDRDPVRERLDTYQAPSLVCPCNAESWLPCWARHAARQGDDVSADVSTEGRPVIRRLISN